MLNMIRALLCPSSGARDYMCVITAYGVRCLGCWLLAVKCRAAGYASRKRDVALYAERGNSETSHRSQKVPQTHIDIKHNLHRFLPRLIPIG